MKAAMEGPVKLKDKQKSEQTHFITRPLWLRPDPGFGTHSWHSHGPGHAGADPPA